MKGFDILFCVLIRAFLRLRIVGVFFCDLDYADYESVALFFYLLINCN